jgi:malate synthase
MAEKVERCPWCGSQISHEKFLRIQEAIRDEERRKLAAAVDLVKKELEKQRKKELAEVRQILQKDRETAFAKREAEFAREREALQKKIVDISRRVSKGGELADGSDLDIYDELRSAFPDDQLVRRGSGHLLLDVQYKRKSAGKLLIATKPRAAWQQAFVTKLRQEQSESGADHAILATVVFPSGKRELFIESNVIVAAPARVTAIIEVLRKAMIAMHVAKLSDAERADKLNSLFKFITSAAFKRKLAEANELAGEALQIDVDEKRAHDLVWRKRGTLLTRMRQVMRDIDTDISAILESASEPQPLRPAAFRVTSR